MEEKTQSERKAEYLLWLANQMKEARLPPLVTGIEPDTTIAQAIRKGEEE